MRLLNLILASSALGLMGVPPVAHAQILVTDVAAITQSAANQAQTIAQLIQQYQQLIAQFQVAEAQLASIQGYRASGAALLNNGAARQSLPAAYAALLSSILTQGSSGGSAAAQVIYNQVKSVPCTDYTGSPNALSTCQAPAMLSASLASNVTSELTTAQQRVAQLSGLSQQVDATADAKASADLQARIASEATTLAAEKTMLDYALELQRAEMDLAMKHSADIGLQLATQRGRSCYVCP
ncbi:MAG: type IV secretion system protein [Burkholderiaceae bacterium]